MSVERDKLIRKLRAAANGGRKEETYMTLCGDAADEIVRLEGQLETALALSSKDGA